MKKAIADIKVLLREMESTQRWLKSQGKDKNANIQHKIAYSYAVLEFLYKGGNRVHLGRLNSTIINKTAYRCIEDTNNSDIRCFINKVNTVAFPTYTNFIIFSTQASRRSVTPLSTNVVSLTVDGFDDEGNKIRVYAVDFEPKDYNQDLDIHIDWVGKVIVKAYDKDKNVVNVRNFILEKQNPLTVTLPSYRA